MVWAFAYGGIATVAICLAVLLVFQAAVVLLAGIETRQRSLEELSSMLSATPVLANAAMDDAVAAPTLLTPMHNNR